MRKLLDRIADKLGYERKLALKSWPLTFIPDSVMKEREDVNCLPPNYIFPHLLTEELTDDGVALISYMENMHMELYEDDHGSPGKPIKD